MKRLLGVSTTTWLMVSFSTLVMGLLLGGCAGLPSTQSSERSEGLTSEEAILLERAKTYWEARFAQDMQKAFSFEDPVRRKKLTVVSYIRMVGEPGKIYGITVKGVKIYGDQADVEVEMITRFAMPPWQKDILKNTITDDWQKIDGIWYHVLDFHMIRAGKPRVNMEQGTIDYPPAPKAPTPEPPPLGGPNRP